MADQLDITVKLIDQASEDLRAIRGEVEGLSGDVDSATEKTELMSTKTKAALTAMSTAVVGAFALAGKAVIDAAAQYEQTRVAFDTMLGSAEAGLTMMNDLADFAAKTPFELPTAETAGKQLLAMGIPSEDLINTLKILGDVTAGTGSDFQRIAFNFGQVKTQGKLTGREIRDFAVNGVPLIAELADILGVAESAVQDLASNGEIGFDLVEQAFINMTSEGGRFEDLMEKQSHTTLGMISNLKDVGTILSREFGEPLNNLIKPALESFVATLENMVETLRESGLKEFFEENRTIIIVLASVAIGLLIGAFVTLAAVLVSFMGTALLIGAAVAGIVATMGMFIATTLTMKDKIQETVLILVDLFAEKWDSIKESVIGAITAISDAVSTVFNGIISFFEGVFNLMYDIFKFSLALIAGLTIMAFEALGIDIVAVIEDILQFLQRFWESTTTLFSNALTLISETWNSIWESMSSFVQSIWTKLKDFFQNAVGEVTSIIVPWIDGISDAWNAMWTSFSNAAVTAWENVKTIIKDSINWVIGKVNTLIESINEIARKAALLPGISASSIPQIPTVPLLAKGGNIVGAGAAIVGENGPELLSLPRGAQVTPLDRGGITVVINNPTVLSSDDIVEQIGDPIIQVLKQHFAVV